MNNTFSTVAMPWGTGSINKPTGRATWLLCYLDADGNRRQENSFTEDEEEARRMLAKRAIVALRARIKILQGIANGTATETNGKAAGSAARQHGANRSARSGAGGKPVPAPSTGRAQRSRAQKGGC